MSVRSATEHSARPSVADYVKRLIPALRMNPKMGRPLVSSTQSIDLKAGPTALNYHRRRNQRPRQVRSLPVS
ncbi:protein of unknown function [Methylocella tundrae]|uniref:Uncharacterized protein n=1 Tax=Methylocella tundrae TaxID=227605 RepID=A0A4U8YW17_METTU|nr:protein of unknown function [Methylocella tundrae]